MTEYSIKRWKCIFFKYSGYLSYCLQQKSWNLNTSITEYLLYTLICLKGSVEPLRYMIVYKQFLRSWMLEQKFIKFHSVKSWEEIKSEFFSYVTQTRKLDSTWQRFESKKRAEQTTNIVGYIIKWTAISLGQGNNLAIVRSICCTVGWNVISDLQTWELDINSIRHISEFLQESALSFVHLKSNKYNCL